MRKNIGVSITVHTNLKALKAGIAELDGVRKREENKPIVVPVRIDHSLLKSDAVRAAQIYQSEFQKAMGAARPMDGHGAIPPGGSAVSPRGVQSLRDFHQASGAEWKRIETTYANSAKNVVKTVEQLQRGLSREITTSINSSGVKSKATTIVDSRPREAAKQSDQAMERMLNQALRYNQQQRAALAVEEKQAYLIKDRADREAAINNILSRRKAILTHTHNEVSDVHMRASVRGNAGLANKAESAGGTLAQQGIRDMDRLSAATTKSTAVNGFHSSSLLKNAVSFTRWTLAMGAVSAPLAAISSGVAESIHLERAQKTLSAVFRGSKEDAALLAQQTLFLAAANGRDGMEATEAAVAWSRLGLTRTQVLLAVETSLRAAKVAEITAAEATGYLTASYKTFHQTISDIPATLDYLNSHSRQVKARINAFREKLLKN